MSPEVDDPAFRNVSFDELVAAYVDVLGPLLGHALLDHVDREVDLLALA